MQRTIKVKIGVTPSVVLSASPSPTPPRVRGGSVIVPKFKLTGGVMFGTLRAVKATEF
jgi:hypothetical protein